jgi:hypothetical protein
LQVSIGERFPQNTFSETTRSPGTLSVQHNKRDREKGKSREGKEMATAKRGGGQKGLLWRLPEVTSKELGKIGPAFGLGIGCGAGAGIGFFGGKTLFLLPLPLLRISLVDWKVISILRCACSLRFRRLIASGFLVRIVSGVGVSQDGI